MATGGVWSRQHTKKAVSKRLGKNAGVSQLRASFSAQTSGKHSSREHISKKVSFCFLESSVEGTTKVLPKRVAPSRRRHSSTPHSSHVSRTAPMRSDRRRSSDSESLFRSKTDNFPIKFSVSLRNRRAGNRHDTKMLQVAYHVQLQGLFCFDHKLDFLNAFLSHFKLIQEFLIVKTEIANLRMKIFVCYSLINIYEKLWNRRNFSRTIFFPVEIILLTSIFNN